LKREELAEIDLKKITWQNFVTVNIENPQNAFERMCRILFAKMLHIEARNLNSSPNNPGLEVHPIANSCGKNVSFQAKFFSNSVDYNKIEKSMMTAVNTYRGCLDIVYLYCNKDFSRASASYLGIVNFLTDAGIDLVPITNEQILQDIIDNNYSSIGSLYFNNLILKNDWFTDQLNRSLQGLGDRYNRMFSVETASAEYLEIFSNSDKGANILNSLKQDAIDTLRRMDLYAQRAFFAKVIAYIEDMPDVTGHSVSEAFLWFDNLTTNLEIDILNFKRYLEKQEISHLYEHNFAAALEIIDFKSNYGNILFQKSLLVGGRAGEGKSHLLGFFGKSYFDSGGKVILLLGQKFINSEKIEKQLIDQLSLDCSFDVFMETLNGIGERDNKSVVIVIDAINESRDRGVWFEGLGDFISKIDKYDYVKFIFSVRSTYESLVISHEVKEMFEKDIIARIIHTGFQGNVEEAIEMFSDYYGITFAPKDYFNQRLANPLFMTLYCKTLSLEPQTLLDVFDAHVKIRDDEIKQQLGIQSKTNLLLKFIEGVSERFVATNSTYIDESDLLSLNFWDMHGLDKLNYITLLEQCNIIHSGDYHRNEEIYYYFSYELMADYFMAKYLLKKLKNKSSVDCFIRSLFSGSTDIRSFSAETFGVLSALYAAKFGEECVHILDEFTLQEDDSEHYRKNDIHYFKQEYVSAYSLRLKSAINPDIFFKFVEDNANRDIISAMWNVLLANSIVEGHPLNARTLHSFLSPLPIAVRDSFWTLHINNLNSHEESVYNYIVKIQKGNALSLYGERVNLTAILLTWLLSSSNRALRDNTSEAIVEVLKNNFELNVELLTLFNEINDPYVIQRLYGCIFGACTKRTAENKAEYTQLANYIYHNIFCVDKVYPDILLRDYARLTLEKYIYEYPNEASFIEKSRIYPPYNSDAIPIVEKVESYRIENDDTGWNYIESSMRMSTHGWYGDFGRYVFQSALNDFEGVDLENCYQYAMQFIRDELGYDKEYLYESDKLRWSRTVNFDRHHVAKTERIGKKYQWIAFYNILARIADKHNLKIWWNDKTGVYKGAWNPYVRDFDPTLNSYFLKNADAPILIQQIDFEYRLDSSIETLQPIEWAKRDELFFSQNSKFLHYLDEHDNEWISLISFSKTQLGSYDYDSTLYEMWAWTIGYLISNKAWGNVRNDVLQMDFRNGINSSTYQIFNREHFWSPSYHDMFSDDEVDNEQDSYVYEEPPLVEQDLLFLKEILASYSSDATEMHHKSEVMIEREQREAIEQHLIPAKVSFSWEEEYDASQEESVSYEIPTKCIVDMMKLKQLKYDGSYYNENGELVAFDTRLSNQANLDSRCLVIRKDVLIEFLKKADMSIFWFSFGEKMFNKKRGESYARSEWKGFYEFDNNNDVQGEMRMYHADPSDKKI